MTVSLRIGIFLVKAAHCSPESRKLRRIRSGGKAQDAVSEATGVSWEQVSEEIYGKVFEALGLELSDEIIEAWESCDKLRKLIESLQNPEDRTIVELTRHEVKASVYPCVEIFVDEKSVGRLDFGDSYKEERLALCPCWDYATQTDI